MGVREEDEAKPDSAGTPPPEQPDLEPLRSLFSRLIHDAGAMLRAEMDLYRSLALQRLIGSRIVMALAAAGILFIAGSFTAMLTGFVFALARQIGPLGAALAVGIGGIAIGLLLLKLAGNSFRKLSDPQEDEEA